MVLIVDEARMASSRMPPPSLSTSRQLPRTVPGVYSRSDPDIILNKDLDLVRAPDFFPIREPMPPGAGLPIEGFTSNDPRLIDTLRNNRLVLDKPALQPEGVQPLCRRPLMSMPNTGTYDSYEDIRGGQLQYYKSALVSDIFEEPVYQIPSNVIKAVYQDPMGSLKPYYDRRPILQHNAQLSEYSFDQDQMEFREDLMSKQSSLMDRTDWDKFHGYSNP